ncbi:MAG: class I SAM-dependent methyltransferase [Methanosarcinales archaeon]|nr:MAG: class I SAM-dependent methyltransferase [Methanosarcinales archaeon]
MSEDPYCIDPAYWSNTAREYYRKIVANGKLLRKLKKYVDSDSTVLDIGAGTGYLTLALAPYVKKVASVEPSEGMLNILREKAEYLGIHNIDYINRKWEDAKTSQYDIVLASHSISCTKDPLTFFQRMHECARRFVFLIVFTDFEIFKSYRRFFYTRKDDIFKDIGGRINEEYVFRNLRETKGEFFLDIETYEVMIWYKKR